MRKQFLFFSLIFLSISSLQAQVPVADFWGRTLSRTTSVVAQASEVITNLAEPLVNTFGEVQDFFHKAELLVNGVIKNMQLIEEIVDLNEDIQLYFNNAITVLQQDNEHDFIDKWKHIQILLALSKEATGGVDLFINIMEDEALVLDDKNRIVLLQKIHSDLRKIHTAMRIQIRRINKEIFAFTRLQQERQTFEQLFSN